jgi:hypothetical protein
MASPSSNTEFEALAAAWLDFQNRAPVKFGTIATEGHYQAMVKVLDELDDEIGDRESHPMVELLDIVSFFVHDYEERTTET